MRCHVTAHVTSATTVQLYKQLYHLYSVLIIISESPERHLRIPNRFSIKYEYLRHWLLPTVFRGPENVHPWSAWVVLHVLKSYATVEAEFVLMRDCLWEIKARTFDAYPSFDEIDGTWETKLKTARRKLPILKHDRAPPGEGGLCWLLAINQKHLEGISWNDNIVYSKLFSIYLNQPHSNFGSRPKDFWTNCLQVIIYRNTK